MEAAKGARLAAGSVSVQTCSMYARQSAFAPRLPASRHPAGFSQGQRVKTAIARALIHDPRNVILDEPTNGLDVMATRAMRQFMLRLRGEGRCVLFSSHIMQEVAALCDRVVVIANGRVVADESPAALRDQTGEANLEDAFVKIIGSEEGLAALYDEKAIVSPGNGKTVQGREEIEKLFKSYFDAGVHDHTIDVVHASRAGNVMYETANWTAVLEKDGKKTQFKGVLLKVMTKSADGKWPHRLRISIHVSSPATEVFLPQLRIA